MYSEIECPGAVLHRAQEIALAQGALGVSPAQVLEGKGISLCAGSCVAEAAMQLRDGPEAALSFRRSAIELDKQRTLPALLESYGLKFEDAVSLIRENDAMPEGQRLSWFLSLRSVQQAPVG